MEDWNPRDVIDGLVADYLPLVYNVVGWALSGHPDSAGVVRDVVRETMISAVPDPRDDAVFRSRLLVACVSQVRRAVQAAAAQPRPSTPQPDGRPEPDFVQFMVERLGLVGEQREVVEASRWLTAADRLLLALWRHEASGALYGAELADALRLSPAVVAEAVARMTQRLDDARVIERALRRSPHCQGLIAVAAGWDGEPAPTWHGRLAAHVLKCPVCQPRRDELSPAEWLFGDLPLVPPPPGLMRTAAPRSAPRDGHGRHGVAGAGSTGRLGGIRRPLAGGGKARLSWPPSRSAVAVISAVVALCVVGGLLTVFRGPGSSAAASDPLVGNGAPLAAKSPPASAKASASTAGTRAPAPATFSLADQKGVATTSGDGVSLALAKSGAAWYYNWGTTPAGIITPPGVTFVPMIHDASDVTPTVLNAVKREGRYLLGFNEPDHPDGANMTVSQALDLWPKLEATGMLLGSPAIAFGTNSETSWLGRFMQGARARGYRVDFITVHWYGQNNWDDPAANVAALKKYLTQTHSLWGKPIWITELALTRFLGGGPEGRQYPTEAQQAAFLTAAAQMLSTLHFVYRYAWYALSASGAEKGTTALYTKTAQPTEPGIAFKNAP